jgi:tripartite-type tricarboxylate transporter receptor subunit TctC
MHLRRCSYATLLGLMASCIAAAIAGAQGWPQRFVTLVVPFGAGSGTDVVARIFAARRSEVLGKQVVVENIAAVAAHLAPLGSPRPHLTATSW